MIIMLEVGKGGCRLWEHQPVISGVGLGFKTAPVGTVASQHVLPMVDSVAGTGVMLRRFLERADEMLL
jgi:hypothetical protein